MVNALTPKHLAEKRAGFHELFFDLIFVYAIQKNCTCDFNNTKWFYFS